MVCAGVEVSWEFLDLTIFVVIGRQSALFMYQIIITMMMNIFMYIMVGEN
jgi:hypothetical protein